MKTELVVNREELSEFLSGISLGGSNAIESGGLNIKPDKISTAIVSPNKTIIVLGNITGEFVELGDIGVDSFSLLKNSLQLITEKEIVLSISENKLSLKNKKSKINLILRKMDYIKNSVPEGKTEGLLESSSGNEFNLREKDIQELNRYYNLVKPRVLDIVVNKNTMNIIGDNNSNTFELNIELDTEVNKAKTRVVSEFLMSVLGTITKDAKISLNDSPSPIQINNKKGNVNIVYFIAPIGE